MMVIKIQIHLWLTPEAHCYVTLVHPKYAFNVYIAGIYTP